VCIRQRIEGSNPSLTATFKKELVRKYGLFFRLLHGQTLNRIDEDNIDFDTAQVIYWSTQKMLL
ncbi:MAG: hypothetical protein RR750_19635, partial [Citrobacter sp.]